jgi:hypothetical protein
MAQFLFHPNVREKKDEPLPFLCTSSRKFIMSVGLYIHIPSLSLSLSGEEASKQANQK